MNTITLPDLLTASANLHNQHLCPKQVIGVRMGMLAGEILGLDLPQTDKRLFTIVETDGCFTDGVAVSTGCWLGRRTMQVADYGKVAATFIDLESRRSLRLVPDSRARLRALDYAPQAENLWQAQLLGYQSMPAEELFKTQWVDLILDIEKVVGTPEERTICRMCGEEIMNQREIHRDGDIYCQSCLGGSYYFHAKVV